MEHVEGRMIETVKCIDGRQLHGEFFTHLLRETGWNDMLNIHKFQVIQNFKDEIVWTICSQNEPDKKQIEIMDSYLSKLFKKVEYNFTEDIAPEKGKFLYLKSNLSNTDEI